MTYANRLALLAIVLPLAACGGRDPDSAQYGPDPALPEIQRGLFPNIKISTPADWNGEKPTVPQGYSVEAIATGLKVPRQTLVLPNGDILVAEGRGGSAAKLQPKDVIAGFIKAKGTTQTPSGA